MQNHLKPWMWLWLAVVFFDAHCYACPQANATSTQVKKPRVFLAGPDVFLKNAKAVGEELKAICERYGLEGVFSFDAEIDLEQYQSGKDKAEAIFKANVKLLNSCEGVLANMEPFRGPGADGGTTWEMGCAFAQGKPIIAYSKNKRSYVERVPFKKIIGERAFDKNGMEIETFGLADNLMPICGSVYFVHSFEEAVALMAKQLGVHECAEKKAE